MTLEGMPFEKALGEAQRLGFAEADPTFDVEGIDAAHKLCILIRLAFQCPARMSDIVTGGITKIDPIDIEFAFTVSCNLVNCNFIIQTIAAFSDNYKWNICFKGECSSDMDSHGFHTDNFINF